MRTGGERLDLFLLDDGVQRIPPEYSSRESREADGEWGRGRDAMLGILVLALIDGAAWLEEGDELRVLDALGG
jgi:hypothetical protein